MKLTMNSWDINTYLAMFEWLALAARWDQNSEGTIARFWEGLNKGIHSWVLDRDRIPQTMGEWKAAARVKVARSKEKYNAGLMGTQQCNQKPHDFRNYQSSPRTNQSNQNSGVVPMEVDMVSAQTNFKKLTPKECTQLTKEGRCFQCRLQGHMARNCPKNANRNFNSSACEQITTNHDKTIDSSSTSAPTTPPTKLTKAQQVRAIEESMTDEECTSYLDSRDMGLDFWSAGA